MSFKDVNSQSSLPELEEETLKYWQKNEIFRKSIENRENAPLCSFYDGPPFATGTPHYGHIVGSTMKDTVPRYWTMKGFQVPRKWGWDCHGLPIENIAEGELGIKSKKEIEEMGAKKFNEICRSKVLEYTSYWEKFIPRLGRWADMTGAYKTMDPEYMESVWWVFKNLYDQGLIYEGYRSMYICPRCETTLSQSEVAQGYKTVKDLSVIAEFELLDEPNTYVLAWTTTPWTLIANVALAVGDNIDYVKIEKNDQGTGDLVRFILAKDRLKDVFVDDEYEIVDEFKGDKLVGKKYKPLFDYYSKTDIKNKENGWKIYTAPFVQTSEGTGIVHIAPGFGEDDLNLGKKNDLPFIQHIGMDGVIKSQTTDFAGLHVKPIDDVQKTDVEIVKYLAKNNLLFSKAQYEHSYPHCWRCETPLLNFATSSWFVAVEKIKDEAVELAEKINWSPEHIKNGRFGKWLEGARDWSISRQRYWASVIPIWRCATDDGGCGEIKVIGSIDEISDSFGSPNKFYLIRHGEADSNINDYASSYPETQENHLTEKGKHQIEEQAKKLIDKKIDLIFASPLLRTKETAEIISRKTNTEITFDDRLKEISAGKLNGQSWDKIYALYPEGLPEAGDNQYEIESEEDLIKRTKSFIDDVNSKYKNKNILIVSHGDTIRSFKGAILGKTPKEVLHSSWQNKGEIDLVYSKKIDLHKDVVDEITIPCPKCQKQMHRIPDVLDTWFDSGSMPYAQKHFPFENEDDFEKNFPAKFIAEGEDQTRCWFYYLHVISTIIKKDIAYENVIVNGTVVAEDGKKMSKRLKNYPDPMEIINKYGADPLRMYLLTSQVMQAENLNFSEKDLAQMSRGFFRMLWNSYSFFILYANIDNWSPKEDVSLSENVLDKWILSELNQLVKDVDDHMENYELVKASRAFLPFVDNLSNWYIRRSRKRFQKEGNEAEKDSAYQTLYTVLEILSKLLAPFAPFVSEEIYRNLTGQTSVHLVDFPVSDTTFIDKEVTSLMAKTREIIEEGLSLRSELGNLYKNRQPLGFLKYGGIKLTPEFEDIIADEVNVKKILFDQDTNKTEIDKEITEELKLEGQKNEIIRLIQDLRKKSGCNPGDLVEIYFESQGSVDMIFEKYKDEIKTQTKLKELLQQKTEVDQSIEAKIDNQTIWLGVKK